MFYVCGINNNKENVWVKCINNSNQETKKVIYLSDCEQRYLAVVNYYL